MTWDVQPSEKKVLITTSDDVLRHVLTLRKYATALPPESRVFKRAVLAQWLLPCSSMFTISLPNGNSTRLCQLLSKAIEVHRSDHNSGSSKKKRHTRGYIVVYLFDRNRQDLGLTLHCSLAKLLSTRAAFQMGQG